MHSQSYKSQTPEITYIHTYITAIAKIVCGGTRQPTKQTNTYQKQNATAPISIHSINVKRQHTLVKPKKKSNRKHSLSSSSSQLMKIKLFLLTILASKTILYNMQSIYPDGQLTQIPISYKFLSTIQWRIYIYIFFISIPCPPGCPPVEIALAF